MASVNGATSSCEGCTALNKSCAEKNAKIAAQGLKIAEQAVKIHALEKALARAKTPILRSLPIFYVDAHFKLLAELVFISRPQLQQMSWPERPAQANLAPSAEAQPNQAPSTYSQDDDDLPS